MATRRSSSSSSLADEGNAKRSVCGSTAAKTTRHRRGRANSDGQEETRTALCSIGFAPCLGTAGITARVECTLCPSHEALRQGDLPRRLERSTRLLAQSLPRFGLNLNPRRASRPRLIFSQRVSGNWPSIVSLPQSAVPLRLEHGEPISRVELPEDAVCFSSD